VGRVHLVTEGGSRQPREQGKKEDKEENYWTTTFPTSRGKREFHRWVEATRSRPQTKKLREKERGLHDLSVIGGEKPRSDKKRDIVRGRTATRDPTQRKKKIRFLSHPSPVTKVRTSRIKTHEAGHVGWSKAELPREATFCKKKLSKAGVRLVVREIG